MDCILAAIWGAFMGVIYSFVTLDPELLNRITNTCNANQNIKEVVVEVYGIEVYCNDGAKFTIEETK